MSKQKAKKELVKTSENAKKRMIRVINLRYEAAQTTEETVNQWAYADAFSADAGLSADTRSTIRNRARYEVANNSYASGVIKTLADDCVGTGPRLQIQIGNAKTSSFIEKEFSRWATEIKLSQKLRSMRMAKATDGESFAIIVNNPKLKTLVKTDLVVIESERITNPYFYEYDASIVDGIEFDSIWNPCWYYMLRVHPGSTTNATMIGKFDKIPAENMIHWFKSIRPEQHRGVSELAPALNLFSQLRRYTLAVLAAAETAADFSAVVQTNSNLDEDYENEETDEDHVIERPMPGSCIPLKKRSCVVLPDNCNIVQLKAEQPTTTYADFKKELLNEIGRCLSIPRNIMSGDSSGYNYASGRLDQQTYYKSVSVERSDCEQNVLNHLFRSWLKDFVISYRGIKKISFKNIDSVTPQWYWDGFGHVDPVKEANAQKIRLETGVSSYADECLGSGKDYESVFEQRAKEITKLKELGLIQNGQTDKTDKNSANDAKNDLTKAKNKKRKEKNDKE